MLLELYRASYTFGGEEGFLCSKISEYIHAVITGKKPSKNDTCNKNKMSSIK